MASTEMSGKQQAFETGATRSADDHKVDLEGHISPEALHYFGQYMHEHRVQRDGNVRASDNWQEGIPKHKYVKSLVRHCWDLWRAWRGTETFNPDNGKVQTLGELCSAILFNVQGLLHELIKARMVSWTHVTDAQRKGIEQPSTIKEDVIKATLQSDQDYSDDYMARMREWKRQTEQSLTKIKEKEPELWYRDKASEVDPDSGLLKGRY